MDDPAKEAPKPQPQPPGLVERAKASPITFAIAAINVAVFGWVESHGSTLDIGTLLRFGANERMHVVSGEWWRLGSYMFLHIGWVHLLWNTYASIGWSTTVEKALGRLRFVGVYLLAGLGAGCVSALAQHAVSAGASG